MEEALGLDQGSRYVRIPPTYRELSLISFCWTGRRSPGLLRPLRSDAISRKHHHQKSGTTDLHVVLCTGVGHCGAGMRQGSNDFFLRADCEQSFGFVKNWYSLIPLRML